jgi:pectate lyase
LFRDDFEADPLGSTPIGWTPRNATSVSGVHFTVVQDGSHAVAHSGWAGILTADASSSWSNYAVSLDVKTSGWGTSAHEGIAFRFKDAQDYLCLVLVGTKKLVLEEHTSAGVTTLAAVHFASQGGTWYRLQVRAAGSSITGSVDGQQILAATAPDSFATGAIGIRSTSPTEYDNVEVIGL